MGKKKVQDAAAKVAAASAETQVTTDTAATANQVTDSAVTEAQAATPTATASAPTDTAPAFSETVDKTEFDFLVVSRFKDKNDSSKIYEVGTSVNKFGTERLEDLVNRKLVVRRAK